MDMHVHSRTLSLICKGKEAQVSIVLQLLLKLWVFVHLRPHRLRVERLGAMAAFCTVKLDFFLICTENIELQGTHVEIYAR